MVKEPAKSKRHRRQRPTSTLANAPLAMTSNGVLLINVTECEGRDLEGRQRFVGVAANAEEARSVHDAVENAFCGAASKVAANMPLTKEARRSPRKKRQPATPM